MWPAALRETGHPIGPRSRPVGILRSLRHRLFTNNEQSIVFASIVVLFFFLALAGSVAQGDETFSRYFEQLRQRRLYSLAEADALSRLAAADLPLVTKTEICLELSRTLAEHAGFVTDEQRNELWQRARTCVQELLEQQPSNPRSVLLNDQIAVVAVTEGDWLRGEREVRPFDEALLNQARTACTNAIEQLQLIEKSIAESSRDPQLKRSTAGALSGFEWRTLQHRLRWQLGLSYRNRAELDPVGSAGRAADLTDAEQSVRRLVGVADEPLQSRVRLLLVVCSRLKGERERAMEMITALDKNESKTGDALQNEITAERVQLLIELKQPTEAAEILVKTRSQQQRLTGELWLLQVRTLLAFREISLGNQQEQLTARLADQIITTISRCEEQVGGYWSRRCQQLWDNSQTAQKYGEDLDTLMQQARSDFNAGRMENALAKYVAAEKLASDRGQAELALELAFTRASILLEQQQFDSAVAEFFRLATDYPKHSRAAKAHLLGTYCLGRLYDEKKTQSRREAYAGALDQHIRTYAGDATINEARFLKAQFEEQRLQSTLALPLYLQVDREHARALDAMAGAARCDETILERMIVRHLPSEDFQREAIHHLSEFLSTTDDSIEKWTTKHAEIALRLASILLMASGDSNRPDETTPLRAKQKDNSPDSNVPVRYSQAEGWITRVVSFTEQPNSEATTAEVKQRLRQKAIPLLIIALAISGKSVEADRMLKSFSDKPATVVATIDRLTQLAVTTPRNQRIRIALMQLRAAEQIASQRSQLSPVECDQLDRSLVQASLAASQFPKAVEVGRQLAEHGEKNLDTQRSLANLFSDVIDRDSNLLAKQCWRRVESQTKAGSAEWLTARAGILENCVRLKQFDEGRKLLQVTKVLYPDLGGDLLTTRFEAVDKELQTGKNESR